MAKTAILKALTEQRAGLVEDLRALTDVVEKEERAFTEEENKNFDEMKKSIEALDETIKKIDEARGMGMTEEKKEEEKAEEAGAEEQRAFADYIKGEIRGERRADANMTFSENGALVPKTIAAKIIMRVKDICPIYKSAEKYNIKGMLQIPYVDEENSNVHMAYATEFTELESGALKTKTIDLTGYLAGALSKISKSLVNNSDFDIVSKVVEYMANDISEFLEKECLIGTVGKIEGMGNVKQNVETAAAGTLTADDLIRLKDSLKSQFQKPAYFIMNPETLTALRMLKDGNGRYLLQDDITSEFGQTLLGKGVYPSDAMPKVENGKVAIYYGDYGQGLAVKVVEDISIQVLQEKFATQHAVGVVAWLEVDAKVQNAQAISKMTVKSA